MVVKLFEFEAAVHGYHSDKKNWVPVQNQEWDCPHEVGNSYDYFAIKICESVCDKIVEHLLMEISHPTKFLMQHGAVIRATLLSTNYRKSRLVQGGWKCIVEFLEFARDVIIERFKDMSMFCMMNLMIVKYWVHFFTIRLRFPKIHEKEPLILSLPPILTNKRRKRQ